MTENDPQPPPNGVIIKKAGAVTIVEGNVHGGAHTTVTPKADGKQADKQGESTKSSRETSRWRKLFKFKGCGCFNVTVDDQKKEEEHRLAAEEPENIALLEKPEESLSVDDQIRNKQPEVEIDAVAEADRKQKLLTFMWLLQTMPKTDPQADQKKKALMLLIMQNTNFKTDIVANRNMSLLLLSQKPPGESEAATEQREQMLEMLTRQNANGEIDHEGNRNALITWLQDKADEDDGVVKQLMLQTSRSSEEEANCNMFMALLAQKADGETDEEFVVKKEMLTLLTESSRDGTDSNGKLLLFFWIMKNMQGVDGTADPEIEKLLLLM